jgi:ribosomal protein S18 acetylase RimI-like enzyme
VSIEPYTGDHRADVRRISCATALLGEPLVRCFTDDETLADALTLYFTDYEPESCFVAIDQTGVVGYVVGTTDTATMRRVLGWRVIPRFAAKAVLRGQLFRGKNLKFIAHVAAGFMRGEFSTSRFSREFPATLHINVDVRGRCRSVGSALLEHYMEFLGKQGVSGVQVSTMSDGARRFFEKHGFRILAEGRRGFLRWCLGRDLPSFVLGRKL